MMNSMGDEMGVADYLTIRQKAFWVEDKAMKKVLDEAEKEQAWNCSEEEGCNIEGLPGRDSIEEHKIVQKGDDSDGVPLIMRKELHDICLKHSGGRLKQPMRRVDYLNVALVIKIPYLLHEG